MSGDTKASLTNVFKGFSGVYKWWLSSQVSDSRFERSVAITIYIDKDMLLPWLRYTIYIIRLQYFIYAYTMENPGCSCTSTVTALPF